MRDTYNQQLFSEFPPVSTEEWQEKIGLDLKGSYQKGKLVWKTGEGFDVRPYYRDEDMASLDHLLHMGLLRPERDEGEGPNSWVICQEIYPGIMADTTEAGKRIREAVRGGAQAVRIHLENTVFKTADIGSMLESVQPGETRIHFTGSLQADALYELLCKLASGKGIDPSTLYGSPGADPIGRMAETGIPVASLENLRKLVKRAVQETPEIRVIEVNGALIRNAGSTLVEELGIALSMAGEYISLLSSRGTEPSEVAASMQMELATGPHYFMEIAGIRAARLLWARVCEAWGIDPAAGKMRIHSTSSTWNMTLYDPYTNMIRGTTEAMSSILGGADMVSVLPFDHPYSVSNGFSQRIARNVQIILREEACFHRVSDPGAGAYYIDNLTHSIAERSWDLFREVEAMGGFTRAFESGWIQETIAASRKLKIERAAAGGDCLLGTNTFPNFNETILGNIGEAMLKETSSAGHRETRSYDHKGTQAGAAPNTIQPLVPFRISSMFEEVRLETERSGNRPKVFLLKHGNPAWAAARATFAGNFFACAGYEIIDGPLAPALEEIIDGPLAPALEEIIDGPLAPALDKIIGIARASGAQVVVLCSEDEAYPTLAPAVVEALGNECLLVLAGYPESLVKELRDTGITHFIHIRTNVLESLREFNRLLLHNNPSEQKPV